MTDNDTNGAFGACKCKAAEELTLLREEMQLKDDEIEILQQLKDDEIEILRKRLTLSEEAVKR